MGLVVGLVFVLACWVWVSCWGAWVVVWVMG